MDDEDEDDDDEADDDDDKYIHNTQISNIYTYNTRTYYTYRA